MATTLDVGAIITAVMNPALSCGYFDSVNGHELKAAPRTGVICEVWAERISPVPSLSGVDITTARVEVNARVRYNMLTEPQDAIDPAIAAATNALFLSFIGNFDLGLGDQHYVDVLGHAGIPLDARAGYVNQDNKMYRVMVLTVPIVVHNVWVQAP